MKVHKEAKHQWYNCPKCPSHYKRRAHLSRHIKIVHEGVFPSSFCQLCDVALDNEEELRHHFTKKHKQSQVWELHDHALKKSVQNWRTLLNIPSGVEALLSEAYLSQIIRFLKVHRAEHPHYRVAFCVMVTWTANPTEDFTAIKTIPVRTCSETVMLGSNLRRISIYLIQDLMKRLEDFEHNGSGYVLQEVLSLDLEIFNFSALKAGCANINMRNIENKNHLLSVNNQNDYCLLYSIAAAFTRHLYSDEEQTDPTTYNQWIANKLLIQDVNFPSALEDIQTLVKNNPELDMNINVYCLQNNKRYPMAKNIKIENQKGKNVINLLRLSHKDGNSVHNGHFVLIKDLDSFLARKTQRDKKSQIYKKKFCPLCLCQFRSEDSEKYVNHKKLCTNKRAQKEILPDKDDRVEFHNYDKKYQTEITGFFDLECVLKPEESLKQCPDCVFNCKCENDNSFTIEKNLHKPVIYSFCLVDLDGKLLAEESKWCPDGDAHVKLLERLLDIQNEILEVSNKFLPMEQLSAEERRTLLKKQRYRCNHCDIKFKRSDTIVLDHHHFTSQTHGLAHQSCNLNRSRKKKIAMFAHNASNYDMHFILNALAKVSNERKVYSQCLPKNSESYRALTIDSYRFLDSYSFLPHSLDELVKDYTARIKPEDMSLLNQSKLVENKKEEFSSDSETRRKFILRKGVFPYEYCSDSNILYEKNLPEIEKFHSSLTEGGITPEDYHHAHNFWKTFNCSNLKDYAMRYCEADVIQLAQVFIDFRKTIFHWAGLDACHYVGLPSLAYDIFLKESSCSIELIRDKSMLQMVQSGIRGGLSFVNRRHVKAPVGGKKHIL